MKSHEKQIHDLQLKVDQLTDTLWAMIIAIRQELGDMAMTELLNKLPTKGGGDE